MCRSNETKHTLNLIFSNINMTNCIVSSGYIHIGQYFEHPPESQQKGCFFMWKTLQDISHGCNGCCDQVIVNPLIWQRLQLQIYVDVHFPNKASHFLSAFHAIRFDFSIIASGKLTLSKSQEYCLVCFVLFLL